jgi:hypothetical protein
VDERTSFDLREGDELFSRDDRPLGRIADVGWNFLDVSTGIFGFRHLYVPSSAIDHVDRPERRIYLNLDHDQVPTEAWGQRPVEAGATSDVAAVDAVVIEGATTPTMAGTMPTAAPVAPAPPVPPSPPVPSEKTMGPSEAVTRGSSAPAPTRPPMEGLIEESAEVGAGSDQTELLTGLETETTLPEAVTSTGSGAGAEPATAMGVEYRSTPSELTFEQVRGRMLFDRDGHAIGHLEGRETGYFDVQTPVVDLGPTLYVPPDAITHCTRFGCYLRIPLEEIPARGWNQVPAEALAPSSPGAPARSTADETLDMAAPSPAESDGEGVRIPYFEDEEAARRFREGAP